MYENDFTDSLPVATAEKIEEDAFGGSIDEFLRRPIDSRCGQKKEISIPSSPPSPLSPENKLKSIQLTVKPSNFNSVLFDWDSTIKKISNKMKPDAIRPKSRGLPNIAKREIQKENEALSRNTIERVSELREKKIVYPLRKNELPLLRKAPNLLNPRRAKRRFD